MGALGFHREMEMVERGECPSCEKKVNREDFRDKKVEESLKSRVYARNARIGYLRKVGQNELDKKNPMAVDRKTPPIRRWKSNSSGLISWRIER
jgi:thioredoxin-related protein